MAVKALFAVTSYEPQTDGTWYVKLQIWSGVNTAANVQNDEPFSSGALATTVNSSLRTFVENYIQDAWEVSFNPLLDSVRMLNPVGLA